MYKVLSATAVMFLSTLAHAEDRATTKDAERMVHQAVTFVQKEGKDKAFAAFNDPKGAFTYRDLYIAVYDMAGKCLAHGQKKERIGKSLIDDKDADGKYFVRERVAMAKAKGKGWQDYKFTNPVSKQIEQKVAYFEVVDGIIVMCGAYKS
jgi:cytochrome c